MTVGDQIDGTRRSVESHGGVIRPPDWGSGGRSVASRSGGGGGTLRGSRKFTPRSAPPPPIPEESEEGGMVNRLDDGRISLKLATNEDLRFVNL